MSKALIPNPGKIPGFLDEAKSQGKGFLVGATTAVLAVPFLGWVFGLVAGGGAVVVWSWKSARNRKRV